jgi:hypothetical protein
LSAVDPSKVYYVVFADDLTFMSLNLRNLEKAANDFKNEASAYDLEVNKAKTKWMIFLPPNPETSAPPCSPLQVKIDGTLIENVDTFVYLGFELDCMLDDGAHTKRLNDRLLKAARASGQIMRDMKCASFQSLRKYFLTLVNSQLYGALFLDCSLIDWDRAVGVFVRSALCLPHSFPNSMCVALLRLRSLRSKVMEERMKFLLKLETRHGSPSHAALVYDRCTLMPLCVGVNARLGQVLEALEIVCTIDYRIHYSQIVQALETADTTDRGTSLLGAGGRVFWTEISTSGWLPYEFFMYTSKLSFEQVRILSLFLADSLKWTALTTLNPCSFCHEPFTSTHFFCCEPASFLTGREWTTFISLCQHRAWQDVVEVFFAVMRRWVTETRFFKPSFVLNVLEFAPEVSPNPFRLSIF